MNPLTNKLAMALKGVIRVADRKTIEFDLAKAALSEYEAEKDKPRQEGMRWADKDMWALYDYCCSYFDQSVKENMFKNWMADYKNKLDGKA